MQGKGGREENGSAPKESIKGNIRLSFEGETSTAGTPFMDVKCGIDSDNYIIYGHNMKNGTMFREIPQYANKGYLQEIP